jgi:hypothetical protein
MRKTKPIGPGRTGGRAPWRPTMRNKANFAQPAGRPIARGKTCKTNPICRPGQAGRVPAGADHATRPRCPVSFRQQTQFGRSVRTLARRIVRNKPNLGQPADTPGAPRETCETNPIFRRDRAGRGPGDEGCCTNKPNPAIMPIRRSAFPGGQLRQTKPIRWSGLEGRDRMCETNPIRASRQIHLGPPGKRAKQTQFSAEVGWDGAPEGEMRKTNPIPDRRDTPLFHCSIIPPFQPDANRAKRTQFQKEGQPAWRGELRRCSSQNGRARAGGLLCLIVRRTASRRGCRRTRTACRRSRGTPTRSRTDPRPPS